MLRPTEFQFNRQTGQWCEVIHSLRRDQPDTLTPVRRDDRIAQSFGRSRDTIRCGRRPWGYSAMRYW